jgi:hypothetical protein
MNSAQPSLLSKIHQSLRTHGRSACVLGVLLVAACNDSKTTTSSGNDGGAAGGGGAMCSMPVKASAGPADSHCGSKVQVTSEASCHPDAGAAQMSDMDAGSAPEFGATMYGMEGDDDDCKYHLSWTATSLCENADVYFTVKVTNKSDGKPTTGADTMPDLSLSDTVPGEISKSKTVEGPDGTYKIGPVQFSAKGKWTVRFHIHGDCSDFSDDSPHGHAAFFVDVP